MNWTTVTERLKHFEGRMASLYVWGLSIILAAIAAIVFNELHALGAFDATDVERLNMVLWILAGFGLFGFGLHTVHILTGTIAFIRERDSS